jgi:hyaluronoglucosaminidase
MAPPLGIIEGYFGRRWGWADRMAVVRTLALAGYSFFHYAPKGEELLRRNWRTPFDDAEAQQLADFAQLCRALGMHFGVGLTPFGCNAGFGEEDRAALKVKLSQLDAIGIDDLALLFDDMEGSFDALAERQAAIADFAFAHSAATTRFLCPSYYSDDPVLDRVFGARPPRYLEDLGAALDPSVAIYWTGEEVCAREVSRGHLEEVADRLGRRPALWDNWPVNDGPRMSQHLHLRAFTGRTAEAGAMLTHHAVNPASQPHLGCIPALSLPQLYALGPDYRYGAAFRDAAVALCGEALAAMLEADLLGLEDAGLDRMSAERKAKLVARYAAVDHPAAREVVDWLQGGYAITGEELKTQ